MNAHTPFDANQDWSNPYCRNSSNDPLVNALLGNAYHVVREVYCNLGNLRLLYDFMEQGGLVKGVQTEAELKQVNPDLTEYVRIYSTSAIGVRKIVDYLYVSDDASGIKPDDSTFTGSWVEVSSSANSDTSGGTYILYPYTATGGETVIIVTQETLGVPFLTVDGFTQTLGKGFTFNPDTKVIQLVSPLEEGQEVICFLSGVPASPDNPSIDNWKVVNWLYNYGAAVGNEQVIDIPFEFLDVPAVYKNGLRLYKGLASDSYTIDSANARIFLTEPLATNDRVILTIGGNSETITVSDRTLQEVARGFNLTDAEVIIGTDTETFLNGKKVVYVPSQQKSYKLPNTVPTNVRIASIVGDQLVYIPGNITVTLEQISII